MVQKPEVESGGRKAELVAELQWARSELASSLHEVRRDLNVVAHVKESVAHKKTAWFTGAALTGWLLSRLAGRKKAAKPEHKPLFQKKTGDMKENERAGFWLLALQTVFNAKPALTALASRKLAQIATRQEGMHRPPY